MFHKKNRSKQEEFRIQKVECNPIILISFWFFGMFFDQFPKNAKQDTKPTLLSVTPSCATATNKTGEPRSRWDALQIHQTTALETLLRKLLIQKKVESHRSFHQGGFWTLQFQGSQTQTAGTMSNGVCLKVAKHRFCCDFFTTKSKTSIIQTSSSLMKIPHLWRQHGPGKKSGSWEATLPKCSLMVMPHDVEGTQ